MSKKGSGPVDKIDGQAGRQLFLSCHTCAVGVRSLPMFRFERVLVLYCSSGSVEFGIGDGSGVSVNVKDSHKLII